MKQAPIPMTLVFIQNNFLTKILDLSYSSYNVIGSC